VTGCIVDERRRISLIGQLYIRIQPEVIVLLTIIESNARRISETRTALSLGRRHGTPDNW